MRLTHRFALLMAILVLATPANGQTGRRDNGWSERGVFVFGAYLFDFWRGISGPAGAHSVSQLADCSNAEYYCLREREFSVALPKVCRTMNVGDSWAVDGVTTRVIARVTLPGGPHHLPMYEHDGFALASDGHDAVFLYDPPYGVLSLHPSARTVAEAGQFSVQGSGLPVLALVSPDSFGPCRRAR